MGPSATSWEKPLCSARRCRTRRRHNRFSMYQRHCETSDVGGWLSCACSEHCRLEAMEDCATEGRRTIGWKTSSCLEAEENTWEILLRMTKDATFLYKDVSLGESIYWATSPHPKRGKKFCWDDHSAWDDFRDSCGHWYHCGWEPDMTGCHKTKLMNSSMTPGNSPGSKLWLQMAAALPGTRAPAPSCWPRNPSLTRNKGKDKKLLSPHWHLGQTGWISRFFCMC